MSFHADSLFSARFYYGYSAWRSDAGNIMMLAARAISHAFSGVTPCATRACRASPIYAFYDDDTDASLRPEFIADDGCR